MHWVTSRRWRSLAFLVAAYALFTKEACADLVTSTTDTAGSKYLASGVPDGAVIEGAGAIDNSNSAGTPWYMDGTLRGTSLESPIILNGFVKGSGTFDNVVFNGTFSPGHSPALLTLGNTIYTASNVLQIELGGLLPGTQHDKVVHNGVATLGGTLDVLLINAFVPQLGNA